MLQFQKVFVLFIRTFARPIVNYTKQYQLQNKAHSHRYLRRFFIFMGNKYNVIELILAQRSLIFPPSETQKIKTLSEDSA